MKVHYTTITTLLVLIPFLLILVVLKETDKSFIESDTNYRSSRLSINEDIDDVKSDSVQTLSVKSDLRCNCDCDKSPTTDKNLLVGDNQDNKDNEDGIDSMDINNDEIESKTKLPTIFIITPTYPRPTQMADMTRLSQTLSLVKDIFWVVTEDSHIKSLQVAELLNRTNIPSVQLLGPRPVTHLDKRSGRGVSNRLKALEYLRQTYTNTDEEGVIYFADDDNAYDIRLFEEIRYTKKVSVFPVGLIAKIGLSTPIVSQKTGKIVGFHDPFISRRKYAVDMAGFAVNLQLFLSRPKATMPYKVGYEEDYFIRSLGVRFHDLEPKANNCTQVLVWHTRTSDSVAPDYANLAKNKGYNNTNLRLLYDNVLKT